MRTYAARILVPKAVRGEALVLDVPLSFFGDVDPVTGEIVAPDSELRGAKVSGKVMVLRRSRGSTVGSYVLFSLRKHGSAPLAIVMERSDPIIVAGCVIAGIPLVDGLQDEFFKSVKTGDIIGIDPEKGVITIEGKEGSTGGVRGARRFR